MSRNLSKIAQTMAGRQRTHFLVFLLRVRKDFDHITSTMEKRCVCLGVTRHWGYEVSFSCIYPLHDERRHKVCRRSPHKWPEAYHTDSFQNPESRFLGP
jgi:hypothetical protein